jgi:RimJ/RimL family protein N-acetyltransferase
MTILTTERLALRPMQRNDFDAYAGFLASERAHWMDGPIDRGRAWTWFTNDVASFPLYGFGSFAVEVDGALAGFTGLVHPPHFPEPECGWFVLDGFVGQGIATEAARAVIAHTFATTQLTSIVSYIAPQNKASVAVALRLGAQLDPTAAKPAEACNGCDVYRHTKGGLQ